MERSISAARQQRLHPTVEEEPAVLPSRPAIEPDRAAQSPESPPRLKARPKRSTTFPGFTDDPVYRQQAG
jgi:hypothetical protein